MEEIEFRVEAKGFDQASSCNNILEKKLKFETLSEKIKKSKNFISNYVLFSRHFLHVFYFAATIQYCGQ